MSKKTTTKKTTTKSVKNNRSKKINKEIENDSGSLGMIILAVLGLVLLIYFGTNSDVNVDVKISNEKKQELVEDSSYTISGKKYASMEEAYQDLKSIPQTRRTQEETKFVESYKTTSY
tara:strand:- start:156 stop:509 length:354 start_codon:yes stop_codon:yes gene_type:complete